VSGQHNVGCGTLTTFKQPPEVTQTLFAQQHIPDLMIETHPFLQESDDSGHSRPAYRTPITVRPQQQPEPGMSNGIGSLEVIHAYMNLRMIDE
jgi:hypothetical protein